MSWYTTPTPLELPAPAAGHDGRHDATLAVGVIRDVESPSYETAVSQQVDEVKAAHGFTCLRDMILAGDTWEVPAK